jgi:hypothetical protein
MYVDPVFGTTIKRVTGSHEVIGFNGERAAFSQDDKYFSVAVGSPKGLRLFDGRTGESIKDIPLAVDPGLARWSYDPEMVVYPSGSRLVGLNVRTGKERVLRDFGAPLGDSRSRLCGGDGNDFDDAGEWLLVSIGPRMFAYDVRTDEVGPAKDMSEYDVDYATVSASGEYIVGNLRDAGILLWDRNWTYKRQLLPRSSHMELGYLNGTEECVISKIPKGGDGAKWHERLGMEGADLVAARFSDGAVIQVLDGTQWEHFMGTTIGGVNRRYAYFAFESHGCDPAKEWYRYSGELLEVPLDGSMRVRRLAHHRCRTHDNSDHTFANQPEAWVNHAGDRMFFRSNMCKYDEEGKHDLFFMQIPPRDAQLTASRGR